VKILFSLIHAWISDLQKATHEELDRIVALLEKEGIPATASY
jgi:hypothetical protein